METSKTKVATQIKNAFDFIQKLYNESSYLIKEIEGQLAETDYKFRILKPSGYSITARSSTGLEINNVNLWLMRKFAVAFVEGTETESGKSQTVTEIDKNLKLLYFRVTLDDKSQDEPKLVYGIFYDIEKNKEWVKKFENLMGHIEYNDAKIFAKFPQIDYQDGTCKMKGKFGEVNLLDINSSEALVEKVINPAIELYEQI